MRRYIVLICMLGLLGSLYSCSLNRKPAAVGEALSTAGDTGEPAGMEEAVTRLSTQLYASYAKGQTRETDKSSDGIVMPGYFGGAYVDGDKLVVLVKGNRRQGIMDVQGRIGTSPLVLYKACSFSLNELNRLNDDLGKVYFGQPALRDRLGWTAVGLALMKNRVVVDMKVVSDEKISLFKQEVSSSPMIVFE